MRLLAAGAVVAIAGLVGACTIKDAPSPTLNGPSEYGLSLTLQATPDAINQDGGSQSAVKVIARGPDGKPLTGLSLRVDIVVNGVPQDFGALSARNVVTGTDGTATVIYTAPASTGNVKVPTCNSLPGQCVDIVATSIDSNFDTASSQSVRIRLVPPGVILPPADTPTASFQFSPAGPVVEQEVQYDGTASCGGPLTNGACQSSNQIVSYSWNFGDGTSASGATFSHAFHNAGAYVVTLTVTNDGGAAASTTKTVTVTTSASPTASFTVSPTTIHVGDTVFFNGGQSAPAANRVIVAYAWDFGDGATATGLAPTHAYTSANSFTVVLTVTDDVGNRATTTKSVAVVP
jgi:chitodextrinase